MSTKLSNSEIEKLLAKKDLPDNLRKDLKDKQKKLSNEKPFNK
jgi:hypothetical protein